ncbi:hypothetical protein JYP52_16600, partial [Nitratireductor aquibiodomus]|uniref:hypothetical protein n=1 Tax=Nitratireductor aquibiodomus TaxID=204799 RepID=UPI0019D33D33
VLLQYAYDLFFGKSVALHLWSFAWGQSLLQTGLIHWGNVMVHSISMAIATGIFPTSACLVMSASM